MNAKRPCLGTGTRAAIAIRPVREARELRHDAQGDGMQINISRNANEFKQDRRSDSTSGRQTRKILLLCVVNLLVGINIWAQVVAPNGLSASSVCSNSVTLTWVDPNTNSLAGVVEQSVLVLRSTRSLNKGYATIATLPAYTTTYTDTGVVGSKTYYYRVTAVDSNGRKYNSNPISVATSSPLTLSPSSSDVPDVGGSTNVLVTAGSGCGWTASSTDAWITVDSGNTGFGTGTITYSVAQNTSTSSRTGSVTVVNQTVKVTQNGSSACTYLASPTSANIGAGGGSGSFTVTPSKNGNACSWATTPTAGWIHTSSSGSGIGMVSYTVDPNTGTSPRIGAITVSDAGGGSATTSYTLTQAGLSTPPPLTITIASPLSAGMVGVAYSQTLAATGGTTPYSWSISAGSLPAGLTLTSGGLLSGTPTTATTASFTVQCTGGSTTTTAFSLTVNPPPLTITTVSPLPAAMVGVAYSGTFTATGGTTPYTWSISAGSLPAGLTLSSGGVLSGTPTMATTANFTVQCTGGTTTTGAFSLTVNPAVVNYTVTTAPSPINGGTTTPNASFSNGSTVTAQATANTGYSFVNWTQNGAMVSTSPSYSFQLNTNVTLFAHFTTVYTITVTASPSSGGTIAGLGNGMFIGGTTVSLTASPATGYSFVNWTENGSVVSSTAAYGFTATANRSLVANFAATSASGNFLWSVVHGGISQDDGRAVAVDKRDGSVLLTGDFSGSVSFGGATISGTSGTSVMLAKYAANGAYQWAVAPTGNGVSQGQAVAVDANGNVFVTGYFANSINFGAPSGSMTSAGWYDLFVAKYSPAGVCLWSKQFGSPTSGDNQGDESGYALAVDSAGNVIVGGSFDGTANFS
ncbi:MAG TPA: putative Ig domain-containing protein, partial [Verrucomicrobiae bacterium]|nr:putative Ig domain-containing protein [Verrucomicrobiae bacterium]